LENALLETGYGLRKLGIMVMDNATKILQLRQARDGTSEVALESVFTQKEQEGLKKILSQLEGQTEALKNPYDPDQLSWAAWTIARLGGWKGYTSSRPPGMKTFKRGLDKFNAMLWAWDIDSG
jgi:hypothetical protein